MNLDMHDSGRRYLSTLYKKGTLHTYVAFYYMELFFPVVVNININQNGDTYI